MTKHTGMPNLPAIDKHRMRTAFDRAARTYDSIADFQQAVGHALFEWTQEWKERFEPGMILDAGCGTGTAGLMLRTRWPLATLVGCDAAPAMLKCATSRGNLGVCADIEQLALRDESVDLCWSSLALQWCRPPLAFAELYRVLKPGGTLVFSTLGPRTLLELEQAFSGIDQHRRFLSFSSPFTLANAMERAGFSNIRLLSTRWITWHANLRSMLATLREIGAHRTGGDRRALMGKQAWQTVEGRYDSLRVGGMLPASYQVIFGTAVIGIHG